MYIIDNQLVSFHIIQRDVYDKNLIVWSYPTLSEESRSYLLEKCFVAVDGFMYLHKKEWIYILQDKYKTVVPNVKSYAVVILAKDFEPIKYHLLCNILNKKYQNTNNPVELLKLFLSAFSTGCCCVQENGTQITYNSREVQGNIGLKELIKMFGIETILIYNCLLLKKRIIVYHNDLRILQKYLLPVTKLMIYRCANDYLYPYVENVALELRGVDFYVAGVTDRSLNFKSDYYDIFVDLLSKEINISPKAKENLTMTKMHKEIAVSMVQMVEKDFTEQQMIEEISARTDELFTLVKNLKSVQTSNGEMITLEALRSKNYNPVMENFLFNLAVAENVMMV